MTLLGQIDRGGGDDYDQHDVMDKTRARTHNSCRNRALKRRSRSTPKQEQGRTKIFLEKAVARSFASPVSEATCKHRTTGRKTMRMRYFSSNTDSFLVEAREQRE
jgi:hypothetical protein